MNTTQVSLAKARGGVRGVWQLLTQKGAGQKGGAEYCLRAMLSGL